jgi:adenylate cyclase
VVGNVGAAGMHSFTAIGDTTNLSARLQAQARPGRIIISRATMDAIGAVAEVEQLGALELKGKQAPVEAFVLVSVAG